MTPEERKAVAALKRLAKRWPSTLTLVQHGCRPGLSVVRTEDADGNLHTCPRLDWINIPANSAS